MATPFEIGLGFEKTDPPSVEDRNHSGFGYIPDLLNHLSNLKWLRL